MDKSLFSNVSLNLPSADLADQLMVPVIRGPWRPLVVRPAGCTKKKD